jgi:hypothetical protein
MNELLRILILAFAACLVLASKGVTAHEETALDNETLQRFLSDQLEARDSAAGKHANNWGR